MPSSEYYKLLKEAKPDFEDQIPISLYNKLEKAGVLRDSREFEIPDVPNRFFKMGMFEVGVSVASVEYSK